MTEKKKVCKECHKPLKATTQFFRLERGGRLHAICKICESKKRHSQDIWKRKAQRTIAYHRLKALEEYQTAPEKFPNWDGRYETWAPTYGWFMGKIARQMEAAFEGVCTICGAPYKGDPSKGIKPMGHGRADMTLDITNRASEPFYADNTRYVCLVCNSRKGANTLDEERERKKAYQIWRETECADYQTSFPLPELPSVFPITSVGGKATPAVEGKAVAAKRKHRYIERGEQLILL